MRCLLLNLFLLTPILTLNMKNTKSFGPYEPVWKNYELCKGPKFKNASNTKVDIFKQRSDYYGILSFNFIIHSTIDELRLWLYSITDETRKQLWTYKLSEPCKNFVFVELLQEQLNADQCVVEKGRYNHTVNFTEVTRKLIGPAFFYGNYSMKAIMTSKNANILCLLLDIELVKKIK